MGSDKMKRRQGKHRSVRKTKRCVEEDDLGVSDEDNIPLGFSASLLHHHDASSTYLQVPDSSVSRKKRKPKSSLGGSSVFHICPPYRPGQSK